VAVVDTNVWVSAFLNPEGFPARILKAAGENRFSVLTSVPIMNELYDVLNRPRLRQVRQMSLTDVAQFIDAIVRLAHIVPIAGTLNLCRDPSDDMILETAIAGKATHIVSRDEDLTRDVDLVHELEARGIQVVTVNNFLVELAADEAKDTEER
jgi:putative PIN family toxin of toxin-antitoxin system